MTTTVRQSRRIPIAQIVVGERRRLEYGDLHELAASIEQYGLIHPIVVDADGRLVAGERRLKACQSLGWTEIDVRDFGALTDAERSEIELEENLRRKDLTPYERSRTLTQLADTAKAVVQAEIEREARAPVEALRFTNDSDREWSADISTESVNKSRLGRPANPFAESRIAERIGVPNQTVRDARLHVETADAIPALQAPDWKQYHVLHARDMLRKLPEPERAEAAALIDQPGIPPDRAIPILTNLAEMPAPERGEVFRLHRSTDDRDRDLALTKAANLPPMPDPQYLIFAAARDWLKKARQELERATRSFPGEPHHARVVAVIEQVREVDRAIDSLQQTVQEQHARRVCAS